MTAKGMIDTNEAAEMIGIKPETLRQWRYEQREDQPVFHKIGRKVAYRKADVERWIARTAVSY